MNCYPSVGGNKCPLGPNNSSLDELRAAGDPTNWSPTLLLRLQQTALLPESYSDSVHRRAQYLTENDKSVGLEVYHPRSLGPLDCLPLYKNSAAASRLKEQFLNKPEVAQWLSKDKTKIEKPMTAASEIVSRRLSRAVVLLELEQVANKHQAYIAPYHHCLLGRHGGFCAATIGLAEQLLNYSYPWTRHIRQRLTAFLSEGDCYNKRKRLELRTVAGEVVKVNVSPANMRLDSDDFAQGHINGEFYKDNVWRNINSLSESKEWLAEQLLATPEPRDWSPILRRRLATLFSTGHLDNKWVNTKIRAAKEKVILLTVSREMLVLESTQYGGNAHKLMEEGSNLSRTTIAPPHQCKLGYHRGFCAATIGLAEQLRNSHPEAWSPSLIQRLAVFLPEGSHHNMKLKCRFRTVYGGTVRIKIKPYNLKLQDMNEDFFKDESWDELINSELNSKSMHIQTDDERATNITEGLALPPTTSVDCLPLPRRIAIDWLVEQLLATSTPADWSSILRQRLATLIPTSYPDDAWLIPQLVSSAGKRVYVRICREMLRLDINKAPVNVLRDYL